MEAFMIYPSSMRILGSPFYPLTHDLDDLNEYLLDLFLYKDYVYIVEQSLALLEHIKDEIFQAPHSDSYLNKSLDTALIRNENLQSRHTLYGLESPESELEMLLFTIHRNSAIRLLVEGRGYPVHSAIRSQVDDITNIPDDVLVYLYAAMKASQALMEVVSWMFEVENELFEKHGVGTIQGAAERLSDTEENYPEIYTTLINEIRSENLEGEVDTALYSSILLGEAKRARLLASVYPSLDEAKRQKESLHLVQQSKREASTKGGKKRWPEYRWAREYIKSKWPSIAYDDSQILMTKRQLILMLVDKLLPEELERQKHLPNPEGISKRIPGEKALGGNGTNKPGWLVEFGYNELPKHLSP
ncbi:hypothetical protein [Vreelandella titanicae]|uniref:hypothetical protein n=1 Tax=Vreelandella titanicae TaxID=664683 RepID=UPI003FD8ACD5